MQRLKKEKSNKRRSCVPPPKIVGIEPSRSTTEKLTAVREVARERPGTIAPDANRRTRASV